MIPYDKMAGCCGSSKSKKKQGADKSSETGCVRRLGRDSRYQPIESTELELELVQLHTIFRHGARTPLNYIPGLTEASYDKSLDIDLPESTFNFELVKYPDGGPAGETLMEPDLRGRVLKGGCRASILTTVGQKQMMDLGAIIQKNYMRPLDIGRFSPDLVRIRTTHLERTIKSLRCVLAGIFGKTHMNSQPVVKFPVKSIEEEDLYPNKLGCPALRLLVDLTLSSIDYLPGFTASKKEIINVLGLPSSTYLDFACLRDDIVSRTVHGNDYPTKLLPYKDVIEDNAARTLHAVYSGRRELMTPLGYGRHDVTKLSIGRILFSIITEMESTITGIRKPKLYLYAAHDTTLAPLLEALGIWEFVWPPFASSVFFELYKSRRIGSFYTRVLYNGEPKTIREQTDELILFSDFKECLKSFTLSHHQFKQTCAVVIT